MIAYNYRCNNACYLQAALNGWAYFVSLVLGDSFIKAKVGDTDSATVEDLRKKLQLNTSGRSETKKKESKMDNRGKFDFPEPNEVIIHFH